MEALYFLTPHEKDTEILSEKQIIQEKHLPNTGPETLQHFERMVKAGEMDCTSVSL